MSLDDAELARQLEAQRLQGEMMAEIRNLKDSLKEGQVRIEKRLDDMSSAMVTKAAFQPVRLIAFGLVSILLTLLVTYIVVRSLDGAPRPQPTVSHTP